MFPSYVTGFMSSPQIQERRLRLHTKRIAGDPSSRVSTLDISLGAPYLPALLHAGCTRFIGWPSARRRRDGVGHRVGLVVHARAGVHSRKHRRVRNENEAHDHSGRRRARCDSCGARRRGEGGCGRRSRHHDLDRSEPADGRHAGGDRMGNRPRCDRQRRRQELRRHPRSSRHRCRRGRSRRDRRRARLDRPARGQRPRRADLPQAGGEGAVPGVHAERVLVRPRRQEALRRPDADREHRPRREHRARQGPDDLRAARGGGARLQAQEVRATSPSPSSRAPAATRTTCIPSSRVSAATSSARTAPATSTRRTSASRTRTS